MISLSSLLTLFHLIGLALCVGAATIKVFLLIQTLRDYSFVPVYIQVVKPITRVLLTGLILMTLTGIIWILTGYPLISSVIVKLVLVLLVWIIGPVIDKSAEPRFEKLAAEKGTGFQQAQRRYLVLEIAATSIFYIIIIYWVLF